MPAEIKICGLTVGEDARICNQVSADYAGMVLFFEKSRRCIPLQQAKTIAGELAGGIKKVAVTVSPKPGEVEEIIKSGFDILQIHGELSRSVLDEVSIPVWYACNISTQKELERRVDFLEGLPGKLSAKITGILIDGQTYGGGKVFDWAKVSGEEVLFRSLLFVSGNEQKEEEADRKGAARGRGRKLILAGGLTPENVAEGIRIFSPDIVDVSTGVEGIRGKDRQKAEAFVEAVRRERR